MREKRRPQVDRLRKPRQRRRDSYQDGPADVIPFGPPAPRTPAAPPTAANVVGGYVTKRRTWTPGLSMTLAIDVEALARALLGLEEDKQHKRRGNTRKR
jgi:hypothetical protein